MSFSSLVQDAEIRRVVVDVSNQFNSYIMLSFATFATAAAVAIFAEEGYSGAGCLTGIIASLVIIGAADMLGGTCAILALIALASVSVAVGGESAPYMAVYSAFTAICATLKIYIFTSVLDRTLLMSHIMAIMVVLSIINVVAACIGGDARAVIAIFSIAISSLTFIDVAAKLRPTPSQPATTL